MLCTTAHLLGEVLSVDLGNEGACCVMQDYETDSDEYCKNNCKDKKVFYKTLSILIERNVRMRGMSGWLYLRDIGVVFLRSRTFCQQLLAV